MSLKIVFIFSYSKPKITCRTALELKLNPNFSLSINIGPKINNKFKLPNYFYL